MKKLHYFDEVFDAQEMFRRIMDAMANPTKTISVSDIAAKMYGETPELLAVAMTLLDNEVSYCAYQNPTLSEQISLLTHAREENVGQADFIFMTDTKQLEFVIETAKCGTLADPHRSAVIIALIDDQTDICLRLFGAGIDHVTEFFTSQIVEAAIKARDQQMYEYPQGIDFLFISKQRNLFAVPRLTLREGQ